MLAPPPPPTKSRPVKTTGSPDVGQVPSNPQADILGILGTEDVSHPKQSQEAVASIETRSVSSKRSLALKTGVGPLATVVSQSSVQNTQTPTNQSAMDKGDYFKPNPQSLMNIVNEDPRLNKAIKSAATFKGRWETNKGKLSFWLGKLPVLSVLINMKKVLNSRSQMQGSKRLNESSTNPLTKKTAQGQVSHKRQQKNSKLASTAVGVLASGVSGGTDGGLGGLAADKLTGLVSQGVEIASNMTASKIASYGVGKKTSGSTKETHHEPETLRIGYKPPEHKGSPESHQQLSESEDDFEERSYALDDSYMMRAFSNYLSSPSMLDDPQGMIDQGIDPEVEEARVALKFLLGSSPDEDLSTPESRRMTPVDQKILEQLQISGSPSSENQSELDFYKSLTDVVETMDTHQISELRVLILLDGQIR